MAGQFFVLPDEKNCCRSACFKKMTMIWLSGLCRFKTKKHSDLWCTPGPVWRTCLVVFWMRAFPPERIFIEQSHANAQAFPRAIRAAGERKSLRGKALEQTLRSELGSGEGVWGSLFFGGGGIYESGKNKFWKAGCCGHRYFGAGATAGRYCRYIWIILGWKLFMPGRAGRWVGTRRDGKGREYSSFCRSAKA